MSRGTYPSAASERAGAAVGSPEHLGTVAPRTEPPPKVHHCCSFACPAVPTSVAGEGGCATGRPLETAPLAGGGSLSIAGVTAPSPMFKMVFLAVLGLTVLLLLINVGLAVLLVDPSEAEADVTKTVQSGWQMGFSTLVGLIGGKALS